MSKSEFRVQVVKYPDRAAFVLRWRDPMTNRMMTKTAGTTIRKEATRAAGVLQAELESGKHQPANKLTWAAFKERLYAEYYPTVGERTQEKADTVIAAIERVLNPQLLSQLTNEKLSFFASQVRSETTSKDGKTSIARGEATVASYLRVVLTILRWAHDLGLIATAPKLTKSARSKGKPTGKARAVTAEEFDRLLVAVPKGLVTKSKHGEPIEPTAAMAEAWRFLLSGLWSSGFRLGEALRLSWDDDTAPRVDMSGKRGVVRFPAGSQKSGKAETWPMPPDFVALLESIPEGLRRGRVFKVSTTGSERPTANHVMRVISGIGEAAGIIVAKTAKGTKYASAHDLRRGFCTRWARLVMPQVLCRMARHASVQTTMSFYVTQSAEDTADVAFAAWERQNGTEVTKQVTSPSFDQRHLAADLYENA